jgi:hypothetical protein
MSLEDEASAPSYETPIDTTPSFVEGEFERPRTTALYRFSLVLVSLAMILLPVLYLAVVALFGWAIYYYAVHIHWFTHTGVGGRAEWVLLEIAYIFPLFIGGLLFLFLIKPLFAPKPPEAEHFSLELADAPQLFAFIGWICRSLEAPIPSRIDVDCNINASAGFRSGFRSLLGNDLVLTIGLPLAAGMSVSQLGGIIAHEYGHFSQGAAMRASYIIRRINLWLYRVVYERDAWDLWLVEASEDPEIGGRAMIALHLARAGVWLSRRPPWLLFWLGHLLSSYMARQMEFNADRYEIKMSGSEGFISASLRSLQLNAGYAMAQRQLAAKWKKEKKLFDQIPDFIVSRANEIPADTQGRLHAHQSRRRTRLFDTHPSDAERVDRARAANEPGILHSNEPARSLFANFPELCRKATVFYYGMLIGPEFTADWLVATEPAVSAADYDYTADRENIRRFTLGIATQLRPMILPESKPLVFRSQEALMAEIRACREAMRQSLPVAQDALTAFVQADARMVQLSQAAYLSHAGVPIDPAVFNVPDGEFARAQAAARHSFQSAAAVLGQYDELVRLRLADALLLLRLPQFAATLPDAVALQERALEMVFVLARMDEVHKSLLELRTETFALDALWRHRLQHGTADNLPQTIESLAEGIRKGVKKVQLQTGQIRYPFPHAIQDAFVSHFARNKKYCADPLEAVLRESSSHIEKLFALEERLLSHVIQICEKVEAQAGVQKLPACGTGPGRNIGTR